MHENHSLRCNFPFLTGVQLAVNAIPDILLLVDSPACGMHTAHLLGNHDLHTTLMDPLGFHRVFHTGANIFNIPNDRTPQISGMLRKFENSGRASAILLTSGAMAAVTGHQYDKLIRELNPPARIPVIHIPRKDFSGDWLAGYAQTLEAIAKHLPQIHGDPGNRTVAIVGYLMDRNENDHKANIAELERILKQGLGLKLASVWLGGDPFTETAALRGAGTIISLPYAREAARARAAGTRARLIETGLPFGIGATVEWIHAIAAQTGAEERAGAFIRGELEKIIPRLEWAVPRCFTGKRIVYCGDPHLLAGVRDTTEEFGCSFTSMALFSRPLHADNFNQASNGANPCGAFEPPVRVFRETLKTIESQHNTDLFISNSIAARQIRSVLGKNAPVMNFGFPSYEFHAPHHAPFLGFAGAMNFISRMMNTMRMDN